MRQFDASNWLKPDFEFMGALETPIEAIDGDGVVAKGKRIEAANVIWCAGVEASPVARLSRPCEFPNTFNPTSASVFDLNNIPLNTSRRAIAMRSAGVRFNSRRRVAQPEQVADQRGGAGPVI